MSGVRGQTSGRTTDKHVWNSINTAMWSLSERCPLIEVDGSGRSKWHKQPDYIIPTITFAWTVLCCLPLADGEDSRQQGLIRQSRKGVFYTWRHETQGIMWCSACCANVWRHNYCHHSSHNSRLMEHLFSPPAVRQRPKKEDLCFAANGGCKGEMKSRVFVWCITSISGDYLQFQGIQNMIRSSARGWAMSLSPRSCRVDMLASRAHAHFLSQPAASSHVG